MAHSVARENQREVARMADELTIRLQVLQESGARPRTRIEGAHISGEQGPSPFGALGSMGSADVEAIAFLVLMQAAKSAQEDLKAIMDQVKSINAAKARQRELLQRMQEDSSAAADRDRYERIPDNFENGTAAAAAPTDAGDLDSVIAVLLGVYAIDVERQARQVLDDLDSMSEMGEMESLRLQMAMDRMSKMMSTLSNLLKKISDTSAQITQNLK